MSDDDIAMRQFTGKPYNLDEISPHRQSLQKHERIPSVNQELLRPGTSRNGSQGSYETRGASFELDGQETPLYTASNSQSTKWAGWRVGVIVGCICSVVAFGLNLALLLWARQKPASSSGNYILATGSYSYIETISTRAHLAINVISTIILAGSNYTLQVLLAPTRKAITIAHGEHRSISIGIASFDGWHYADLRRRVLYVSLMILMLPLHLLYNSVIVSTAAALPAGTAGGVVTSDFLSTPPTDQSYNDLWQLAKNGNMSQISASECVSILDAHSFEYGAVIMVSNISVTQLNNTLFQAMEFNATSPWNTSQPGGWQSTPNPYSSVPFPGAWLLNLPSSGSWETWIRSWGDDNPDDFSTIEITIENGVLYSLEKSDNGNPPAAFYVISLFPDHCLVQSLELSTIELFPQLLVIIIICIGIKALILAATVCLKTRPLVTVGDAIASFLDDPDPVTRSLGPISAAEVNKRRTERGFTRYTSLPTMLGKRWTGECFRYFHGATKRRWILLFAPCLFFWFAGILAISIRRPKPEDLLLEWKKGISGTPQWEGPQQTSLIVLIVVCNLPQLVLSLIYVSYNALWTCIQATLEFVSFGTYRKGLRVSRPEGEQRGTYFLSLPYKFSIPLSVVSMLIHWVMSQAMFVVQMNGYNPDGTPNRAFDDHSVGSSYLALIVEVGLLGVLCLGLIMYCLQHFDPTVPLVRGDSLAISASCHSCEEERISCKVLQYGVISELGPDACRVGFSSQAVEPLIEGRYCR